MKKTGAREGCEDYTVVLKEILNFITISITIFFSIKCLIKSWVCVLEMRIEVCKEWNSGSKFKMTIKANLATKFRNNGAST